MSVRIHSVIAVAILHRRIAAGFTETRRLSGSTTASSRTRSSPPQPPAPLMSGMLGAIAISSVSASRQAEGGGGAGAACSAALPVPAGAGFSGSGLSDSAGWVQAWLGLPTWTRAPRFGASAGRGFGSGTASTGPARLLRPDLPEQAAPGPRRTGARPVAAAAGIDGAQSHSTAATVTIAAAVRRKLPQGHFRLAFSALKFMTIPNATGGKRQHTSGGTTVCLD